MFRRLRYRKWLVAGLGLAALVIPTTALAGNQSQLADGRSPDTKDAALAPQPTLDPAIVKYLERYGFSQSQIAAMSGGTYQASAPASLDPAIVKYLERYGFTQSQIAAMSGGLYSASRNAQPKLDPLALSWLRGHGYSPSEIAAIVSGSAQASGSPKVDPLAVSYLRSRGLSPSEISDWTVGRCSQEVKPTSCLAMFEKTNAKVSTPVDGRSPDTIDFATQAHEPVVTVVRDSGFQWGDFGIGLSAALLVLVLLSVMRVVSKDRSGRRPATSS